MHVWVVEEKFNSAWVYTGCVRVSRQQAREVMWYHYRICYPGSKFRVRKYVRV